jgi:hypothetical protein
VRRESAITLSELLTALFILGSIFGGCWLLSEKGFLYGLLGGFCGGIVGCAIFATYGWIVLTYDRWRTGPHRPAPPCRNGECGAWDYEVVGRDLEHRGIIERCQCGDLYLFTGSRFMYLHPDGTAEPYMKRPNRRWDWEPDPEAQEQAQVLTPHAHTLNG